MTAPELRTEDTPVYTIADLAEATGLSERTTRRYFRALGFPDAHGEVRYSERTSDGRLRQPSWRGLRPDKAPEDVVWE